MNLGDFNFDFSFGDAPNKEEVSQAQQKSDEILATPFEISDEDVNRIFGEISEQARNDEEVLASAASVLEAESILAKAEVEYQEVNAEVSKLDSEILEMERQLAALKRARTDKAHEAFDVRTKMNRAGREVKGKIEAAKTLVHDLNKTHAMDLLSDELEARAKKFTWFTGMPNGLKAMQHQWDAMRFVAAGQRVILGDEMGLGKTLSAIGSADVVCAKRILIITPADITGNFVDEIHSWAPHRAVVTLKGETKIGRAAILSALKMLDEFIVVVNYEAWRRDYSLITGLQDMFFDMLICDEAHTMKNASTSAFKGVKDIAHAINWCPTCNIGIETAAVNCPACGYSKGASYGHGGAQFQDAYWFCRSVKNVILMSGTTILNKPDDLFSLLEIIDPVTFRSRNDFLNRYASMDYATGKWVFAPGGVDSLFKRLSGRFLSRKIADAGIILPPQKPIVHQVELDPERYAKQIEVMKMIDNDAEIVLDSDRRIPMVALIAIITRQRQASVWPGGISMKEPKYLIDENGFPTDIPNPRAGEILWSVGEDVQESVKLDKAAELIKEFTARGERVVVFSQFSTALRELHNRINLSKNDEGDPIFSVVFDGQTSDDLRAEVRRNFDRKLGEQKKWDVVLANYKTGGTGLNLTAAVHTIILDREWNPGKENQALARTHRIGQTETTFVHIIEIPDSIDQWMNSLISDKANLINGFEEGADVLKEELLKQLRGRKGK